MSVAEQVEHVASLLSAAEKRVADVLLSSPNIVAFGTVAELAAAAEAGAATVVRFATKIGFDGFSALQMAVQGEMQQRLRPFADRIREPAPDDVIGKSLYQSLRNVQSTLDTVDRDAFDKSVSMLASAPAIHVLSGDASSGAAQLFVDELDYLRSGVGLIGGNAVAVQRQMALIGPNDVVVALDVRRYDGWLLDAVAECTRRQLAVIAVTDSKVSPLAIGATVSFAVSAEGVAPFDSHVGMVALLSAVSAGLADRLRVDATTRLDAVEAAWRQGNALRDL